MPLKHNRHFYIAAGFVLAWTVFLISYYVVFADTWFDEANYAYKSYLTAEGLARPFVDFTMKYGPVGFYVQTAIQWLLGPSMLATRAVFALFFLGMLALTFDLLRRHGGKWLGLIGVSLMAFHPYVVGKFVTINAYSLAGLFSVAVLWFLFDERRRDWQRVLLASLAASTVFLTRYNLLPVIAVLWMFVYWRWRSWQLLALSVAGVLASAAVGMIPYLALDAEFALSFVLAMFGPAASWLPLPFLQLFGGDSASTNSLADAVRATFDESQLKLIMNVFTSYYHLLVLGLGGCAYLLYDSRKRLRAFFRENGLMVFSLVLSILLFIAHYLTPQGGTKIYSLYLIPPFTVFVAAVLHALYRRIREAGGWGAARGPAVTLLAAAIVIPFFSLGIFGYDIVFFTRLDAADTDLARVERGAAYLAERTSAKDVILTIDNPHIFYEAGRYVIPPLINVGFTYVDSPDSALLERYKFYNSEMFLGWLKDTATVVVFQRDALTERLDPMEFTGEKRAEFDRVLRDQYALVGSIENVYFRKVQRGDGVMEVYRRKTGDAL